ncbi:hypothetical protein GLOIN_2v1835204 [Rhizophagus irregularis DAOM 181602=DAOM 197198]|nr:hypothetical protein GLOIN_2v1835204 [Rhizophagus irregularis DAOM 181602=DAOM 197198]
MSRGCLQLAAICWKYYSMISSKMVRDEEGLSKAIADSINKEGPNGVWIIPSRKRILEKLTKDAVVDMVNKYGQEILHEETPKTQSINKEVFSKSSRTSTIDWLNDKVKAGQSVLEATSSSNNLITTDKKTMKGTRNWHLSEILQKSNSKQKIKKARELIRFKKVSNLIEVQVFSLGSTDSSRGISYVLSPIKLTLWQNDKLAYPEDLKKLNDLWKTPNKLKNINKHDDKSIENYERALAFEECKLELKERAAKKSSLIRTT